MKADPTRRPDPDPDECWSIHDDGESADILACFFAMGESFGDPMPTRNAWLGFLAGIWASGAGASIIPSNPRSDAFP